MSKLECVYLTDINYNMLYVGDMIQHIVGYWGKKILVRKARIKRVQDNNVIRYQLGDRANMWKGSDVERIPDEPESEEWVLRSDWMEGRKPNGGMLFV